MDPTAGLDDSEEKKNILPLPRCTPDRPVRAGPVRSVVWAIHRLHYRGYYAYQVQGFSGCGYFSDMCVLAATSK